MSQGLLPADARRITTPAVLRAIKQRAFDHHVRYEHPDLGDDPRPDPVAGADMALAATILGALDAQYPGHPWGARADHRQGIVAITLRGFGNWHYVIHIRTLKSDPGLKSVMRGAGELLERIGVARRGYTIDDYRAALAAGPLIRRGPNYGPPGGR